MSKRVRWIAVLVAIGFLAAGTAQAMPKMTTGSPRVSESGGALVRIADWLKALLNSSSVKKLKGVWGNDGSHIDPNGFS